MSRHRTPCTRYASDDDNSDIDPSYGSHRKAKPARKVGRKRVVTPAAARKRGISGVPMGAGPVCKYIHDMHSNGYCCLLKERLDNGAVDKEVARGDNLIIYISQFTEFKFINKTFLKLRMGKGLPPPWCNTCFNVYMLKHNVPYESDGPLRTFDTGAFIGRQGGHQHVDRICMECPQSYTGFAQNRPAERSRLHIQAHTDEATRRKSVEQRQVACPICDGTADGLEYDDAITTPAEDRARAAATGAHDASDCEDDEEGEEEEEPAYRGRSRRVSAYVDVRARSRSPTPELRYGGSQTTADSPMEDVCEEDESAFGMLFGKGLIRCEVKPAPVAVSAAAAASPMACAANEFATQAYLDGYPAYRQQHEFNGLDLFGQQGIVYAA